MSTAAVSSRCTIRATPAAWCTARNQRWRRSGKIAIDHHVDLAPGGHEHDYERFARMDAHAHRSPTGMGSFVVGTVGKSLYGLGARLMGSAYYENTEFGVLLLRLCAQGFIWQFSTIGPDATGVVRDSGSGSCS